MRQRRIAVAIRKGGVGKSTTAAHLAAGLALAGRRVLVVDLDPQGHLATMLGASDLPGTVSDVLEERVGAVEASAEVRERLWLLGADSRLATVAATTLNRAFDPQLILAERLGELDGFDYVIVDTPPSLSPLTVNALFYAGEVLAPLELAAMSFGSLQTMREELEVYQRRGGAGIRYVLPTMLRGSTRMHRDLMPKLPQLLGGQVLSGIGDYQLFRELSGDLIYEVDPRGRGTQDYLRVTREVLDGEA